MDYGTQMHWALATAYWWATRDDNRFKDKKTQARLIDRIRSQMRLPDDFTIDYFLVTYLAERVEPQV